MFVIQISGGLEKPSLQGGALLAFLCDILSSD
jgi:hypothetical protein